MQRVKIGGGVLLVMAAVTLVLSLQPGSAPPLDFDDAVLLSAAGNSGTMTVEGLTGAAAKSNVRKISWEMTASTTTSTGGAGAGKTTFGPLSFTKALDGNSLALARATANGANIPAVTVTVFKTGTTEPLFTYRLEQVTMGSFELDDSVESVSFNYGSITLTREDSDQRFCWNVSTTAGC